MDDCRKGGKGGGWKKKGGGIKEIVRERKVEGRGRKEKGNRFLHKLPGTTHKFKQTLFMITFMNLILNINSTVKKNYRYEFNQPN